MNITISHLNINPNIYSVKILTHLYLFDRNTLGYKCLSSDLILVSRITIGCGFSSSVCKFVEAFDTNKSFLRHFELLNAHP